MAGTSSGQRLLTAVAVALVAVGGAVGLGRVFTGARPTWQLIAFAVIAVLLAAVCARWSLTLSALASVLACVISLSWVFFPGSTWLLLPTPRTLGLLADLLSRAPEEIRTQVAPTPALGGLLIVALTAVWVASWAAHALADRARAPIVGALAPITLFTFADVTLDEATRPGPAALLLAGVIAVLFADGLGRVLRWGRLEIWRGPSRRTGSTTLRATRGAWGIAATALLVATLAPGVLPGWEHDALLHPRSGGVTTAESDPLVSIQAELTRRVPNTLFIAEASRPAYWRTLSLDTFDGRTWRTADLSASQGRTIAEAGALLSPPADASTVNEQRFTVVGLRSSWVPMATDPTWYEGPEVRFDPAALIVVRPGGLREGDSFAVSSRTPELSAVRLDGAPDLIDAAVRAGLPAGLYERYTQLPPGTPPVVSELATRWTRGQDTQLRRLLAIQERFRTTFDYDLSARPPDEAEPIAWFLQESRSGFCQQFAGTMAAMARSLGYPARVAVGYLPGTERPEGGWEVTTSDAHAWPEVYFAGIGWVAFEPTPGRTNPDGSAYLDPAILAPAEAGQQPPAAEGDPDAIGDQRRNARRTTDLGSIEAPSPEQGRPWTRTAALVAVLLWVVGLLSVPPLKAVRRWWWLRRAHTPRKLILAGYHAFESRAADLGVVRPPGHTLREYDHSLAGRGVAATALLELTARAAYADEGPSEDDARAAVTQARAAARQLADRAGLRRRIVGAFRLSTRSGGPGPSVPG